MNDWPTTGPFKPETWGKLVAYAAGHGVRVECLRDVALPGGEIGSMRYLRRETGGRVLTCTMPKDCAPETTLRFIRMERVCRALEIPKPQWPVTL